MSTLKTHNLQSPDASSVNIAMTPNAGIVVTGIATFNNNVKLLDDDKLLLGTGEDLQIYMNGSASFIDDVGSGDLSIRGSNVILGKPGTTEAMLKAVPDAEVNLYFNGINRLKTTNTGVFITGICTATSFSGDGSNLTNLPPSAPVGGSASNKVFFENDKVVSVNYQITSTKNAMTAGPISINAGIGVTVPSGCSWTIV
jgi:hypothetical protein